MESFDGDRFASDYYPVSLCNNKASLTNENPPSSERNGELTAFGVFAA